MNVLFILEDYIIDPLGIAYLSSFLKLFGHKIDLVNFDIEPVMQKITEFKPDILAYSITTGRHIKFRDLNVQIRKAFPELFSIFGGPHCTFYPQFVNEKYVDAICVGEGFLAFRDVLDYLERGKSVDGIPNIRTKSQNFGDMADLVKMDDMPFPDRELIYKYPKNQENPIRSIMASFFCGLGCRYCVDGRTPIRKINGDTVEIRNLAIDEQILGWDIHKQQSIPTTVENLWVTSKPAYQMLLEDDSVIICSGTHRWLTTTGWKYTCDIEPPDLLITDKNTTSYALVLPLDTKRQMYDITTSTENFIANGLISHNCYAPKYRDIYDMGTGFGQVVARNPLMVCTEANEVTSKWKTELFYFQDDVFPVWKKGWVDEFCKHWKGYNFHIQIRAEMINDPLIKKLKAVGLHGVTFAVESGVEHIRKEILNRKMSNEQIIEAANILHQNSIRFRIENMMGVLDEKFEDTLETLKLNIKCKPTLAWASLWQPYPGTELGDEAIRRGIFNPESDKIGFDFFHDTILVGQESVWISNLQKLFGITVRFPFLAPIIPLLCKLPKNRLYNWIYRKFKQWTYESRLYKVKPHLRGSKQMDES